MPTLMPSSTISASVNAPRQAGPEGVVHGQVVGGEELGELRRELLALGEPVEVALADLVVERLVDVVGLAGPRGRVAGRAPAQAELAVVDAGDGDAGRLELADRQRRVLVDRGRELGRGDR